MSQEKVGLELDIDAQGSSKTLKELKAEIKSLNSEMLNVKEGSKAYQTLAQRAGEAKESIKDIREATNLFTRGGTVAEIANVGQTIAGGFAAAAGAAALFGGATEDIQKQMLKVQASIAIVEGIKSAIAGWESVQRLLNLAMAANPIGLVIAAVVALTAAVTAYIMTSKEDNTEWERKKRLIDDTVKSYDNQIAVAQAGGKSTLLLEKEKNDAIIKTNDELLQRFIFQDRLSKEEKELRDKAFKDIADARQANKVIEAKSNKEDADERTKFLKDEETKAKEAGKKAEQDLKDKIARSGREWMNELELKAQLQALRDAEDARIGKEDVEKDAKNKSDFEAALAEADRQGQALTNVEIKNLQEKIKQQNDFENAKYAIASAGADAIGALASLAEQGSDAAKALALTQIAIGTGVAFIRGLNIAQEGAVATGPAAPFAFPIFYATQIAAILSAASRAKSILGAGGSTPSAPSMPRGGSAPQINNSTTGATTLGIDQQGNYNGTQKTQVIKAYVVESELTGTQKNVASIIKKSKIQ